MGATMGAACGAGCGAGAGGCGDWQATAKAAAAASTLVRRIVPISPPNIDLSHARCCRPSLADRRRLSKQRASLPVPWLVR